MAFLSKIGSILRQTTSMHVNAELSASRPGLFQVLRSMSTLPSSKLFVGGISFQTDDQSLREAFSKYGEVIDVCLCLGAYAIDSLIEICLFVSNFEFAYAIGAPIDFPVARIIMDRETGRSRGFGFVTYTSSEDASSALQALDGQVLHGRQVRVNYANERPPRNFGGGGFNSGYGSGGYGGGGGGYGGGSGGYGGGGGGYDRNDGFSSGNYGGNVGYGNTGGSSYGGQGSYGGGNNYGTGSVSYGSDFGQSGVDGGNFNVGGSDSFATGGSTGYGGDSMGFGDGENGYRGGAYDGNDALNDNSRDEDESGDFVKRA
ncbi:glycine-rich RNA-binding protein 2, mitochondrial-like [Gossypium australe]|uniref:Glycine-rich RNA-binding protein 2, mitochondrial-like n=1 Tax=Gossypium australe TaxID=47621 RepID=A0A5B6W3G4_9ROSI|nr:glycine-rich RNA-binding protein 2, mitochondrial-like [Gossypium australe]